MNDSSVAGEHDRRDVATWDRAALAFRQAWRRIALPPAFAAFMLWTCVSVKRSSWTMSVIDALFFGGEVEREAVLVAALNLLLLSPIPAWYAARRAVRSALSSSTVLGRPGGEGPPWLLSGGAPWWALRFLLASLAAQALGVTQAPQGLIFWCAKHASGSRACAAAADVLWRVPLAAFAYTMVLALWWLRCEREATRIGLLTRAEASAGGSGFVLRRYRGAYRVLLGASDTKSGNVTLRDGSLKEVWNTLGPKEALRSLARRVSYRGNAAD